MGVRYEIAHGEAIKDLFLGECPVARRKDKRMKHLEGTEGTE